MASKTNSDAVRELEQLAATLRERLDNTGEEVTRLREGRDQAGESLNKLDTRVAMLEAKLGELAAKVEEKEIVRRQLGLLLVGSLITLAANLLLFLLGKR